MKVLVDGIFFQLASTGIARVWVSLLRRLNRESSLTLFLLDRGGCPTIAGIETIPFPSYTSTYTATDSLQIQKICDRYEIDVFTSTYYTTATTTPQVQMVYDMIPEVMKFNMSARPWKEKQLALSYASRFACISKTTRSDLHRFYPGIGADRSRLAYCGVETEVFNPQASQQWPSLRDALHLEKPYLLLVGSREQHQGYKNAKLLFDALAIDQTAELDVLCIGGEANIPKDWLRTLPKGVRAKRLEVTDTELATLYTGALALVYPSLYEGFGLPVLEAMACGCPVITTRRGSLAEVAGDAAIVISGHDPRELVTAMDQVQEPDSRDRLVQAGRKQAEQFSWDEMARRFHALLREAHAERDDPEVRQFHKRWQKLRAAQAEVDIGQD